MTSFLYWFLVVNAVFGCQVSFLVEDCLIAARTNLWILVPYCTQDPLLVPLQYCYNGRDFGRAMYRWVHDACWYCSHLTQITLNLWILMWWAEIEQHVGCWLGWPLEDASFWRDNSRPVKDVLLHPLVRFIVLPAPTHSKSGIRSGSESDF